ncbi:hypothetical protein C9I98_00780 [Photobacterium sanctipauli]|uniref:Uncharacterized protein n=1 Tax=Photobacterium sanctipauli TaxID=1342794 RepID=A0A2T3NZY5_9GAMM|nr:hypothetical protein [Photobacterium sanctipauli]PSW21834.1 hypothetical protein C9I98_00780 [Photobacterium sanctipauli]
MLATGMFTLQMALLVVGLAMVGASIAQYGKRTHDWAGVVKMFYKRVEMTTSEYKSYRLGVALFVLGVVVRIVNLTFWPV